MTGANAHSRKSKLLNIQTAQKYFENIVVAIDRCWNKISPPATHIGPHVPVLPSGTSTDSAVSGHFYRMFQCFHPELQLTQLSVVIFMWASMNRGDHTTIGRDPSRKSKLMTIQTAQVLREYSYQCWNEISPPALYIVPPVPVLPPRTSTDSAVSGHFYVSLNEQEDHTTIGRDRCCLNQSSSVESFWNSLLSSAFPTWKIQHCTLSLNIEEMVRKQVGRKYEKRLKRTRTGEGGDQQQETVEPSQSQAVSRNCEVMDSFYY